jgi:hypothetical protein
MNNHLRKIIILILILILILLLIFIGLFIYFLIFCAIMIIVVILVRIYKSKKSKPKIKPLKPKTIKEYFKDNFWYFLIPSLLLCPPSKFSLYFPLGYLATLIMGSTILFFICYYFYKVDFR